MSCDFNTKVMAWYDGELPAGERAAVESHLSTCAECTELVSALRATSQAIVNAPRATMSADALKRLEQSWWANRDRGVLRLAEWLTAAAAAVLVGALMFWSDGDRAVPVQASAWQAAAVMPPSETHEEVASNVVDLAEWMASDLEADRAADSSSDQSR